MTPIPTVEQLRKSGHKVRVTHRRATSEHSDLVPLHEIRKMLEDQDGKVDNEDLNCFLWPKGGETIVEIRTPEGIELVGKTVCSKKEAFNKKLGRSLALIRALGLKPEAKFKVGDEVWNLRWDNKFFEARIRQDKIIGTWQFSENIKVSDDCSEIEFEYPPNYTIEDNMIAEKNAFLTKEELIAHLES